MPTTGDLISLNPLVLTDTFNTWLNRTNQIVDSINPLQVYDVDVGVGSTTSESGAGLVKYTGEDAGNYNGVITIGLNPGPGIGYETIGGQSRAIVDFQLFDDYNRALSGTGASGSATRVAASDELIINDVSDTTTSASGTAKKVQARHMLPPELVMDSLTISGNVVIMGSLSTMGDTDFIASNNLRIEDKQIELGYQQAAILGLTGVTGGTFFAANGPTAYYFTASTGLTPAFYGHVQSYTGAAGGPTAQMWFGSLFQDPYGAEDVGATGYISFSPTGAPRYLFNTNAGVTNSFLGNASLDEGGIVLKGSEGDKSLLWIWTDNDSGAYYDGWMSASNLGVTGNTNAIISRVYRSYGYDGVSNSEFIFTGESTKNTDIYLAETLSSVAPLTFTGGSWKFSRGSSNNYLSVSVGSTGISSMSESFVIAPGASGVTYAGITAYNFARKLNVDMLDGAHAATSSAAYTIPVADAYGKIDPDFVNADSVRRRYTQAGHGLTAGLAVRYDASAGFTAALATTPELAETIGIVSTVHSANEFTVTHQGRITGLSGPLMTVEGVGFTAGNVYFLGASASHAGKFIYDPDYATATRIAVGQVRKPMLIALSATHGYVLNHSGSQVPEPTDEVYLSGLVPVGTIQAYAGSLSNLPSEWLLCDGDRYRAIDYPELYNTIGDSYEGRITFTASGTTGTMVGGTRNLEAGDTVTITPIGGATAYAATVDSADSTSGIVTFSASIACGAGTHRIIADENSSGEQIFFVPDLRTRSILGGSTGSSDYTNVGLDLYEISDFGGSETVTIDGSSMPAHLHNLTTVNADLATGSQTVVTGIGPTGDSGIGDPLDTHTPYLVAHYIIRAKATTYATILTGHNHDDSYHPLDGNFTIALAATAPYSEDVPNGFNVIVDGVVLGADETVFTVFADPTPRINEAKTEAHVRGDFSVFANGLTTIGATSQHTGETFFVRTHQSRIVVIGGTGSAQTLTRPNPSLEFRNGISGGPAIGYIFGLTSPSSDDYASNKYYADTADKTVKYVGSSNSWNVKHDALALSRTPTTIINSGYQQNNGTVNSKCQTTVYGDLFVYGDGLSGSGGNLTGHTSVTLAVNPRQSEVLISGSDSVSGRPTPTLTFYNSSTPTTKIGTVAGLKVPTADDQAANKYYVDAVYKIEHQATGPNGLLGTTGIGPWDSQTDLGGNIQNGIWYVSIQGTLANSVSSGDACTIDVNGKTIRAYANPSGGVNRAPIHFSTIIEVDANTITLQNALNDTDPWYVQRIVAFKIGGQLVEILGNS
jgi:microcystin-dependent protein